MAVGEKLGPSWSEEDLSEVALLLDVSPQETLVLRGLGVLWRERLAAATWKLRMDTGVEFHGDDFLGIIDGS